MVRACTSAWAFVRALARRLPRLPQAERDPVTGDALSVLEYATRQVQVALRSPWFIVGFNLVTVAVMFVCTGYREDWNYFASWLAIMVEWIVGTFMWGQTRRDALVLREVRAMSERIERLAEAISAKVDAVAEDVQELEASEDGQSQRVS